MIDSLTLKWEYFQPVSTLIFLDPLSTEGTKSSGSVKDQNIEAFLTHANNLAVKHEAV